MKKTTAIDRELRSLRTQKVMQALQAGRIGPGSTVATWQSREQLAQDFEDVRVLASEANSEIRCWTHWGHTESGGWTFSETDAASCKMKRVEFDGPVARCWEVLDRGTDLVLAQSVYVEDSSWSTLWRLPSSYWPEWSGRRSSQDARAL